MPESLEISVVVPVHNEAGNAAALAREIADAMSGRAFELIFVNDASTDSTLDELVELKSELPQLRVLSHRKNGPPVREESQVRQQNGCGLTGTSFILL